MPAGSSSPRGGLDGELARGGGDLLAPAVARARARASSCRSLRGAAQRVEHLAHDLRAGARGRRWRRGGCRCSRISSRSVTQELAEQAHQRVDLALGARPVLLAEGVERERLDAEPAADADDAPHRGAPGLVPGLARLAARLGPAAVAVHDDADVARAGSGLRRGSLAEPFLASSRAGGAGTVWRLRRRGRRGAEGSGRRRRAAPLTSGGRDMERRASMNTGVGLTVTLRVRMGAHDAHYAGELVDGARVLALFGDVATELLIRLDGDEGLFRAYEAIEFLAPVRAGDYIEATGVVTKVGNTSRAMAFEARKVIANVRDALGAALRRRRARRAGRRLPRPRHLRGAEGAPAPPAPRPARPLRAPARARRAARAAAHHHPAAARHPHAAERRAHPDGRDRRRRDDARADAVAARSPRRRSPTRPRAAATPAQRHPPPRPQPRRHALASRASSSPRPSRRSARRPTSIVQTSTGGAVGMGVDERAQPLDCQPEMATLNCGTLNFGDDVFVNTRPLIRDLAARIRAAGSVIELECYEVGHIDEALAPAARRGSSARPLHFQFVLGVPGGIGAREDVLRFMASQVPAGATWGVAAVGPSPAPDDRARDAPRRSRARRAGGQHLPGEGRARRGQRAARGARRGVREERWGARWWIRSGRGSCSGSGGAEPGLTRRRAGG